MGVLKQFTGLISLFVFFTTACMANMLPRTKQGGLEIWVKNTPKFPDYDFYFFSPAGNNPNNNPVIMKIKDGQPIFIRGGEAVHESFAIYAVHKQTGVSTDSIFFYARTKDVFFTIKNIKNNKLKFVSYIQKPKEKKQEGALIASDAADGDDTNRGLPLILISMLGMVVLFTVWLKRRKGSLTIQPTA
jgi:hypothetical protein